MAFDQSGKFHLSPQRARMADRQRPQMSEPMEQDGEHDHPAIHHIEVHPHGDGTHHTVTHHHDGNKVREDHQDLSEVHGKLDEELGEPNQDEAGAGDDGLGDEDGD